VNSKLHLALE